MNENKINEKEIKDELRDIEFKVVTLKNYINSFSGGTPLTSRRDFYEGNINFIGSGEIGQLTTHKNVNTDAITNSSAKLIGEGDLLYAMYGATAGNIAISPISGAINQAILCIRPNEKLAKDFLYQQLLYMKDDILKKYIQGGQGNLSAGQILNLNIKITSLENQEKIGKLLSSIDDLIAHNEERAKGKQDMLRYYKDIVLGNQKSEYAFETKPLKNFLSNVVDKSTIENQYPLLTSSKSGIHLQSEYFNGDIVVKSTIGNKIIKRGQITYRSMSDTGSFTFNVQNIVDCGLVSSAYPVMNTHNINTLLLTYCLNDSLFFKRQLCSIKEGSTRMALSYSKLETMKINIMKDYDVQCKLINLLSGLENEISLINERVNNLKVMKQHYLNVIFK